MVYRGPKCLPISSAVAAVPVPIAVDMGKRDNNAGMRPFKSILKGRDEVLKRNCGRSGALSGKLMMRCRAGRGDSSPNPEFMGILDSFGMIISRDRGHMLPLREEALYAG